jgi:hypothetical protein
LQQEFLLLIRFFLAGFFYLLRHDFSILSNNRIYFCALYSLIAKNKMNESPNKNNMTNKFSEFGTGAIKAPHISQRHKEFIFICICLAVILLRVWLVTGVPKELIYGPHDDLFFAKAAHYIIQGDWMGPYNQMTLIKGPFYSFFMIGSFLTGLSLYLNETLFYVGACMLLFYATRPLIHNRWWRLLLLVLLLFAPASLTTISNLGVRRDFVYLSLSLYVVAFSIGLFLRLTGKLLSLFLWSGGLGLSMGAFMITREESVWIYPMLFLLFLVCLLIVWRSSTDRRSMRTFLIILPILIWQIPGLIVSYLNYTYYGFWGVAETLDPDLNRVLNDWARIEVDGNWHPAIQISKGTRIKVYEAVPLLGEMKDSIENSVSVWQGHDDFAMTFKPDWYLSKYSNGGNEISSGHFLWLFRDVVAEKGYYSGGKFPGNFYGKVADQIEEACNNGRLKCSSPRNIPFIGAIDRRHLPIILRMFYEGVIHLLKYDYLRLFSLDIRTWPRWPAGYDEYKYFQEFVYDSMYSPGIPPQLELKDQYVVNTRTDIRIKMLARKEKIIFGIANFYSRFTLLAFTLGFIIWVLLVFLKIFGLRPDINLLFLCVSGFVLGLFAVRLMTLSIVDATTSVAGIFFYSDTTYIFIYIFSFLMVYGMFDYLVARYRSKRSLK